MNATTSQKPNHNEKKKKKKKKEDIHVRESDAMRKAFMCNFTHLKLIKRDRN